MRTHPRNEINKLERRRKNKDILREKFLNSLEWKEQAMLAKDSTTRQSDLETLSKSPNWNVRLLVAKNTNTRNETVVRLSGDDHEAVAKAAMESYTTRKASGRRVS